MKIKNKRGEEGEPNIDDMRYDLAEQEAMNMGVSQIIEILLDGVQGLNEIPNIEIKDEWNQIFGDK
tara:strand:+ start:74 stop:271 length:198 start_codon:yes stop_codon:yes gene_type:complete